MYHRDRLIIQKITWNIRERDYIRSTAIVSESKQYTWVMHKREFLVYSRSRLRSRYTKISKKIGEYFAVLVIVNIASNKCKVCDSINNCRA